MAAPSVRILHDAVLAALGTVANLKVYDGEIPQKDPPAEIAGSLGRVRPYAVLYAGGGRAWSDRLVGNGGHEDLNWTAQVTVAAGYVNDCTAAVDRVRAALTGQRLTIADGSTGPLHELLDQVTVRFDDKVTPGRFYVPILWSLRAQRVGA